MVTWLLTLKHQKKQSKLNTKQAEGRKLYRVEIYKIEKDNRKSAKLKVESLKKRKRSTKLAKPLPKTNQEKEKTQEWKRGYYYCLTEVKKVTTQYSEHLDTSTLDNLNEQIPRKQQIPKLIQEEIENLNKPVASKEAESVIFKKHY